MFDLKSGVTSPSYSLHFIVKFKVNPKESFRGSTDRWGRFFDAPPAHRGDRLGYQPAPIWHCPVWTQDCWQPGRVGPAGCLTKGLAEVRWDLLPLWLTFKSVTEFFSWRGCCLHSCLVSAGPSILRIRLEVDALIVFDVFKGRKGCHLFKWHSALGKECFWFLECLSEAIIPWLTRLPFKCLLTLAPMLGSEDLISILLLKPACFESSPEF